jgi:hypothetical protein
MLPGPAGPGRLVDTHDVAGAEDARHARPSVRITREPDVGVDPGRLEPLEFSVHPDTDDDRA